VGTSWLGDEESLSPYLVRFVEDGRHLMENDYSPSYLNEAAVTWLAQHILSSAVESLRRVDLIPEHPNFREQYQRMGEQTT
jgi:hypothetical protein